MARAFGSLAYGTGCYLLGNVSIYGEKKIILSAMFVAIALALSVVNIFDKNELTDVIDDLPDVSYKVFLHNNHRFVMMCAVLALIFFSYFAIDNYMLVIVENIKGNSTDTGKILAIKAYLEVPIIFLYTKLVRRFSIRSLLKLSSVAFLIKSSLIYFAGSLFLVYLAQLFQGLSFGLLLPAMVDFVDRYVAKREANRGQSLFIMSMNIGSIAAGFIAGNLCDKLGVRSMELIALLVCLTGVIMFWILMDFGGRKNVRKKST